MSNPLYIIGAPSSAGAYSPGQEKAPEALRAVGFVESLRERGVVVKDLGNVPGFRWRVDRSNARAMNANKVAEVARAVASHTATAFENNAKVLVLGGDCTTELGTIAGALKGTENIGLVYIDGDTDLNTPKSVKDGALDWMGVAHMLGVQDCEKQLVELGTRVPMLQPNQVHFFATHNVKPFEREIIERYEMAETGLDDVIVNPSAAAQSIVNGWSNRFDRLLIHLDVDVLDYLSMPLAENIRRNIGLGYDQLMTALGQLLRAPNWSALTICEINSDHGEEDGSSLQRFAKDLVDILAESIQNSG